MNCKYQIISESTDSSVVAEYTPSKNQSNKYQSEEELEQEFIQLLKNNGYEYISIKQEEDLILNLRRQLEKLNNYQFSNKEWDKFFKEKIDNPQASIAEKTKIIQEDHIQLLTCDNNTQKNIYLIDKENIHKNHLQVINQYTTDAGTRRNRYDVSILLNGFPIVHIELKRRGVHLKEAFNQTNRYAKESFWSGHSLFEYVQLFVISNGTCTKYCSNSIRYKQNSSQIRQYNTFEFTSWWADANNNQILDLIDFTKTFFAKRTLLNLIINYCVFTCDKKLLVMRPYQVVATEKILEKINLSYHNQYYGSKQSGGYVWHTTGSGKTLTSFKVAQLISKLNWIDKVLFVVDRKDLDYQTMKEYDRFAKGSANSAANTKILKGQLDNSDNKIIISTIQKLSNVIKKHANHNFYNKHIVFIFDECHRSQFGKMHTNIIKNFKKYYIFGFTGTPIFKDNAIDFQTTEQCFGDKLHTYTIINAITDQNVLKFKVNYHNTIKQKEKIEDTKVKNIDTEAAFNSADRINKIVTYIIGNFDQYTSRNKYYDLQGKRIRGFNSIFAVSSIEAAKKYYTEFQNQLSKLTSNEQLKIAIIYSFSVNEDVENNCIIDEEDLENIDNLAKDSRDFLDKAIQDYNKMFSTSFDTSSDKFQNYYKDISQKVRTKEIDLLIVVNMFLTGFDAACVNTLWVDKNLKMHGLLQAFSRTNRILNSVKSFGNIVCFRNLDNALKESLALFGNKDAIAVVLIAPYTEYYTQFEKLVSKLKTNYPFGNIIKGENQQKDFIKIYSEVLKLINILNSFDEFSSNKILSCREQQDYQSIYIDLYEQFRSTSLHEKEYINDDIIFEIELVKQIETNIDYILNLVQSYLQQSNDLKARDDIDKAINSSFELRSKKELINQFIESISVNDTDINKQWNTWVKDNIKKELDIIIKEEQINQERTYKFMRNAFNEGFVKETGQGIIKIMPTMPIFDNNNNERSKKKNNVLKRLQVFLEKYLNIFKEDYLK